MTSNSAPDHFLIDSSLRPVKSGGFGAGTGFADANRQTSKSPTAADIPRRMAFLLRTTSMRGLELYYSRIHHSHQKRTCSCLHAFTLSSPTTLPKPAPNEKSSMPLPN